MTRLAPSLAIVAWFVSSEVVKNDRQCTYRDYRDREHVQMIPAASSCARMPNVN